MFKKVLKFSIGLRKYLFLIIVKENTLSLTKIDRLKVYTTKVGER